MWSYKAPQPGPGCVTDLTAILLFALLWHHRCAESATGMPWHLWAVVPSSRRARTGTHPLVRLGASAGLDGSDHTLPTRRVELVPAGAPSGDRCVRPDRFRVATPEVVRGRHTLLLEDTWVTGASVQSAALALKRAGAAAVTILCLARWLREDTRGIDCATFFESLVSPYDGLRCPLLRRSCAAPA